jgi:hypothetical protein
VGKARLLMERELKADGLRLGHRNGRNGHLCRPNEHLGWPSRDFLGRGGWVSLLGWRLGRAWRAGGPGGRGASGDSGSHFLRRLGRIQLLRAPPDCLAPPPAARSALISVMPGRGREPDGARGQSFCRQSECAIRPLPFPWHFAFRRDITRTAPCRPMQVGHSHRTVGVSRPPSAWQEIGPGAARASDPQCSWAIFRLSVHPVHAGRPSAILRRDV